MKTNSQQANKPATKWHIRSHMFVLVSKLKLMNNSSKADRKCKLRLIQFVSILNKYLNSRKLVNVACGL
ncbi:hypothetical protein BpHYR1_031703 [Brachionus plicatilis]|uniref:Uncharacterized protein n=1 Tax=Brachionus plicatilis TaxID=10195 RepID=A0A3M7QPW2_BRAPC|nr:hypothetical protein BpHYR1_031703 [Brachionus plicatilis]